MHQEEKNLSPYIGGILIGLLQIPSLLLFGKLLGLSSSYGSLSAYFLNIFYDLSFYPHIQKLLTGVGPWQLSLATGIVIGAYLSRKPKISLDIDPYWHYLGLQKKTVYTFSFIGGIFLVFGARLAGGCTSGHGLSGIATLSLSSFIVMSTMFLTAIAGFFGLKKIFREKN